VIGLTISHYRILEKLGRGGMGEVYLAEDTQLGRKVAIKFLPKEVATDERAKQRLLREAQTAATLDHPHICAIYEVGQEGENSFIVLQYVEGETLASRLKRQLPDLRDTLAISLQVADALNEAHARGIIHRDIKPDNVILEAAGSLKLIDLGVVRLPGMEDFPPDATPGTAAYMAPEMFTGEEAGNVATDIYALGVTLFRAFTGEYPYGNADAVSPPRLERPKDTALLRPDLPAWLQAALNRAIAHDPDQRFADMAEIAHEFESGPAHAPPQPRRQLTLYERNPVRFWQVVSALLAIALAVALWRR